MRRSADDESMRVCEDGHYNPKRHGDVFEKQPVLCKCGKPTEIVPKVYTWQVQYSQKMKDGTSDSGTKQILRSDTDDEIVEMLELEAVITSERYGCMSRRTSRRKWHLWEAGEQGFDMWIWATWIDEQEIDGEWVELGRSKK